MELFVVNRYRPGEDTNNQLANKDKLKKALLKKIEERKRKRLRDAEAEATEQAKKAKQAEQEVPEEPSVEPEKLKRKRKKKNKQVDVEETPIEEKEPTTYLVLGKDTHARREKTKRVLPHWLKNASVVSVDLKNLQNRIDSISLLDVGLKKSLEANGITHFFPVQAQVIPWLLGTLNWPSMYWPRDLCVSAPTGSGKTLAFVLPIIQALQKRLTPEIRAMVVLPVQDLAKQVFKVFQAYSANTPLKAILLSSAVNISEEQKQLVKKDQLAGCRSQVDIVVTTPGRLVDHLKATEGFSLRNLRYLIIDEADRVMEGAQNDWLYHVNTHIGLHSGTSKSFQVPPLCLKTLTSEKRPPQKLLFSATLSQDPEKLQQLGLFQPKLFTSVVKSEGTDDGVSNEPTGEFIGKFTTPAELKEAYVLCSAASKPLVLLHLLKERAWRQVLCFTKSREAARRLAALLKALGRGCIKVAEITANYTSAKRDSRLQKFSTGKLDVLVCSDSIARGIDIPNVQCVVSYDMPTYIKNHVHRVGRTGRAGHEGIAVTLLLPKEMKYFKEMMETGRKSAVEEIEVKDETLEEYAPQYRAALEALKKKLEIASALQKARARKWKRPGQKTAKRPAVIRGATKKEGQTSA